MKATDIVISGGTIRITASDDGVNAAGGNDSSSLGGRPEHSCQYCQKYSFMQVFRHLAQNKTESYFLHKSEGYRKALSSINQEKHLLQSTSLNVDCNRCFHLGLVDKNATSVTNST